MHRLRRLVFVLPLTSACSEDVPAPPDVPTDVAWCEAVADWDAQAIAFELEVLDLVNQRRSEGATCGKDEVFDPVPALTMDPALRCAARRHALDMAEADYFDLESPEGETPAQRAEQAEYDATMLNENISAGLPTPDFVVEGWMGSTGLCRNVMNPEASEAGVGYIAVAQQDGVPMYPNYWTIVFGQRE